MGYVLCFISTKTKLDMTTCGFMSMCYLQNYSVVITKNVSITKNDPLQLCINKLLRTTCLSMSKQYTTS